jgi:hypothetical protein
MLDGGLPLKNPRLLQLKNTLGIQNPKSRALLIPEEISGTQRPKIQNPPSGFAFVCKTQALGCLMSNSSGCFNLSPKGMPRRRASMGVLD